MAEGGGFSGVVAMSSDGLVLAGAGLDGGNVTVVALPPLTAGGVAERSEATVSSGRSALGVSGKVRLSLDAARAVLALSFGSHDASLLVAACEDRTVRIWNLNGASGEALCLCTAALPPGAVPIMAATAAQQDGFEEGGKLDFGLALPTQDALWAAATGACTSMTSRASSAPWSRFLVQCSQ